MTALIAKLGEVSELRAGVGFPERLQGRTSGDYPLAKVGDISRVGRSGKSIISKTDHYVDERDLSELKAKLIPQGSVLFAKIGEAIRQNHRAIAGCSLLVDNNAMAAIPTDRIASRYLYQFLRTIDFYRLASATTVPALRKSVLSEIEIPFPPLAEQKRIAGILDAADALRAKRREALAQLDSLLQATFLDLFGDPVANPKGWERTTFGSLISCGPQNGIYKPSTDYGSGTRILRIDAFYDGAVTDLSSLKRVRASEKEIALYALEESDIVINRVNSRSHLGKCALVPSLDEPVIFESNMMRLKLDSQRMLPRFATQFLQTQYVKNQILTACKDAVNQSSINQTDVKSFQVLVPRLDVQRRFGAVVVLIDRQKAAHRAHLAELDTLFASLQSRAFRGEL